MVCYCIKTIEGVFLPHYSWKLKGFLCSGQWVVSVTGGFVWISLVKSVASS